jgi:hypothetical protein
MSDELKDPLGPEASIETTPAAGRPKSVIVFGILNIFFAVTWWFHIPHGPFFFPVPMGIPIGITIWLVVLGIGLLRLKARARRSCIAYAWTEIVWSAIQLGLVVAEIAIKGGSYYEMIRLPGGGPIYSILLLVFMRKPSMQKAFADGNQKK